MSDELYVWKLIDDFVWNLIHTTEKTSDRHGEVGVAMMHY